MLNIILRIQSGVLEGQVLTDGWPDFTMVVSQVKLSSYTTKIQARHSQMINTIMTVPELSQTFDNRGPSDSRSANPKHYCRDSPFLGV